MPVCYNISTSLCSQSFKLGGEVPELECCILPFFLFADSDDDFAGQGSDGLNALAAVPMLDWHCADADGRKTAGCLRSCELAPADSGRACWAEGGSLAVTAWLTTVTEHSLGRFRAANTQTASLATWHALSLDECSNSNAEMCRPWSRHSHEPPLARW